MSNLKENKTLGIFYDSVGDRVSIPTMFLTKEIINEILKELNSGAFMSVIGEGVSEGMYVYVLHNEKGYLASTLNNLKGFPISVFKQESLCYLEKIPVKDYKKYARVLDKVLILGSMKKNLVKDWGITLRIWGNNFEFCEVKNIGSWEHWVDKV